jgi:hypothetical protein
MAGKDSVLLVGEQYSYTVLRYLLLYGDPSPVMLPRRGGPIGVGSITVGVSFLNQVIMCSPGTGTLV